jgi:hypothetical protein
MQYWVEILYSITGLAASVMTQVEVPFARVGLLLTGK